MGAISSVGYLVIPVVLYRLFQQFQARGQAYERRAYRAMALTTVTFWGVYPVGFMLEAALPKLQSMTASVDDLTRHRFRATHAVRRTATSKAVASSGERAPVMISTRNPLHTRYAVRDRDHTAVTIVHRATRSPCPSNLSAVA